MKTVGNERGWKFSVRKKCVKKHNERSKYLPTFELKAQEATSNPLSLFDFSQFREETPLSLANVTLKSGDLNTTGDQAQTIGK